MAAIIEQKIIEQAKKGQGETNARLDALIAEQRRTNQLLEWLGEVIAATRQPA